jgi:hypothetical protein
MDERLGQSLRRYTWVWLAGTLVLMCSVWSTLATVTGENGRRAWLDWLILAFAAYGVLAVTVLVPRVVVPHSRGRTSEDRSSLMRWAFAIAPFLGGVGGLMLGSHQWAMTVASLTTAVLLVYTAITIRDGEARRA